MQLDNNKHGDKDMYTVIKKMVQSLKDTGNRTLGYNSCCALHYNSSCVFRVLIMRHIFCPNGAYVLMWVGGEIGGGDGGEGSRGKGRAKVAGTDSTFGHTNE